MRAFGILGEMDISKLYLEKEKEKWLRETATMRAFVVFDNMSLGTNLYIKYHFWWQNTHNSLVSMIPGHPYLIRFKGNFF